MTTKKRSKAANVLTPEFEEFLRRRFQERKDELREWIVRLVAKKALRMLEEKTRGKPSGFG
ncbi:MAG: hypothetical protein NTV86_08260 [Planctomycetota bacterium]|nr:hypothetical protein [Planctomycetota bacterium]